VKVFDLEHCTGMGIVRWESGIVLDITGMQPQQVEAIPEFYVSHFKKRFPFGGHVGGNSRDLAKFPTGKFLMAGGGSWSWGYRDSYSSEHFDCDIITEVIDFAPRSDAAGQFKRIRVRELSDPVQGQRIMWIRFSLKGRELAGYGRWPGK